MTRRAPEESPIVTTTVRVLCPFVLTYGLYTLFHGTTSAGGGFQGGVLAASMIVMLAFAIGIGQTASWLEETTVEVLASAGLLLFGLVAITGIVFGGGFLHLGVFPIPKATVYATEAIEVGIGATVAAVVVTVFVALAEGYEEPAATGTDRRQAPSDRGDRDE